VTCRLLLITASIFAVLWQSEL